MSTRIATSAVPSPLGTLGLARSAAGLCALWFGEREDERAQRWLARRFPGVPLAADEDALGPWAAELGAYFAGARMHFELPLDMRGSPWELAVWRELVRIPFGETATYGEIAARLGQRGAARAVGTANGRNPIAIVVPCHRVVAAGGALGGYSSGLDAKRWLLEHERAHRQRSREQLTLPLS